jgi:poly-gamma-glutamate capsule biosynthesis protein CapA/YwtB (metallophosphatase superfamily)
MRLLLVGDVMLGRLVNDVLMREPPAYVWGDTLPIFGAADARLCNLECVLADGGAPWSATPKVFHFRSDAKNVAVLRAAGMDAATLANNHTLDFGYDALDEMLRLLDEAGIRHAGAGRDAVTAGHPAIVTVGDAQVGVLAFTDNEPDWEAAPERAGVYYVPVDPHDARASGLFTAIRAAAGVVDLLVVSAHWGPNWGYQPPPGHAPFAHALIDAGADVVFGHSGHVVRGIEFYHGRPILYCAGDFVDDYAVNAVERNDESFIFVLETEGRAARRLRLYPTVIEEFQARRARGSRAEAIVATMTGLCAKVGTATNWDEAEGCLTVRLGAAR